MIRIRRIGRNSNYPSRRSSGDVLQPEGGDKDFSEELNDVEEISKTSVNESESVKLYQIKQLKKKLAHVNRKKKKNKQKDEEEPQADLENKTEQDPNDRDLKAKNINVLA